MEIEASGAGKSSPRAFTWTTAHICAFTFLLHLKPSEPHLGERPNFSNVFGRMWAPRMFFIFIFLKK